MNYRVAEYIGIGAIAAAIIGGLVLPLGEKDCKAPWEALQRDVAAIRADVAALVSAAQKAPPAPAVVQPKRDINLFNIERR